MSRRSAVAAFAAILSVPVLLAGCASPSAAVEQSLAREAVADVPHTSAAIVNVSYNGSPYRQGVGVKVYIDRGSQADIAAAVESALKTMWTEFPVEPAHIGVRVVVGPMSSGATYADLDGVKMTEVAAVLNLDPRDVGLRDLLVERKELEQRYGPWKKPE